MDQNSVTIATAATTAVAKEVYNDTLRPTAAIAGQTIAGPMALLTVPFRMMGHASDLLLEKGNAWLDEKFKNVKPEDQIAPKPNIAVPTMQNLLYNADDPNDNDLRDAFLNLLANAMTKNSSPKVHQSFPHILEEMSPIDAAYLKELYLLYLAKRRYVPIGKIRLKLKPKGHKEVFNHFALSKTIDDPSLLPITIDNLMRLQIITVVYDTFLTVENAYHELENHPFFKSVRDDLEKQNLTIDLKKGILSFTAIGLQFASIVLQPPQS